VATNPEKRERTSEWVLLVILVFALIPVFGGVVKAVGRIALRVTETAAKDSAAVAKIAEDVVMFLNRIGHQNAEAWLKTLDLLKHEREILSKFRTFCDMVILAIHRYGLRFRAVLPESLTARMEQLSHGFEQMRVLGDKMIPQALKDLHQKLDYLKKVIHAGGVPPSDKAAMLLAQTGQKTVTYAEEARLIESGIAKKIVHAGKYSQNVASADPQMRHRIKKFYKQEEGFPDLLKQMDEKNLYFPAIAAASGPIKNEMLSGEILFRSFGPEGVTRGVEVGRSNPIGLFWGRGLPPSFAEGWRGPCAVLDEWNRNGWISMMHIPSDVKLPACTSIVAEQFSRNIVGQFLEGGARQAVVHAFFEKEIMAHTNALYKKGGGKVKLANGIEVEVRQSGWKGINGKIGYNETVIPGAGALERLGATEQQTKVVSQAAQGQAKYDRNN
jgi:hypothetical protein